MAKEAARIAGALGLAGRVYRAGQEKELAAAAADAKIDLAPHVESGVLVGDWSGKVENAPDGFFTPTESAGTRTLGTTDTSTAPVQTSTPTAKKTTAKKASRKRGAK